MKFKVEREDDNFYTVRDLPIFECHDTRGFDCNEQWMRDTIDNFKRDKENGHRPTVIVGHNVKGVEKEAVGFLDNLVLKGKRLYADLTRVPKELKEKLQRNAYPGRSVEVLPTSKRILALALLGGTTPYFSLPQMVYKGNERNERSFWYRSPHMFGNGNPQGNSIDKSAISAAVEETLQKYGLQPPAEEPTIFQLTIPQAVQYMQANPESQIVEGEDGNFYAQGDEGEYYQIPQQVLQYGKGKVAAETIGSVVKETAGNVYKGAKRSLRKGYRQGKKVLSPQAQKRIGMGAAATLGVGAGVLGHKAFGSNDYSQQQQSASYKIDENTGVVYFGGRAIGEIAVYSDNAAPDMLPQSPGPVTVDPVIEEGAIGPETNIDHGAQMDPGDPSNAHLTTLNRADSDQYAADLGEAVQYTNQENEVQNAQLYQLQQEVSRLQTANELLNVSRRAEQYKAYLMDLRKAGTPVGNIDQTVDYMLSQSPDQLKMYKKTLESAPKIQLGAMESEHYEMDPQEEKVKADFKQNRAMYNRLGVDESALKYAGFVRVNRMSNEVQSANGKAQDFTFEHES